MLLGNMGLPFLESQDFLFFLVFPMGHETLAADLARSGLGPRRTWLGLQEQVLVLGSTGTTEQCHEAVDGVFPFYFLVCPSYSLRNV